MTAVVPLRSIRSLPKTWPAERFARAVESAVAEPRFTGARYLQFEITNHCDLQCVECPQRLMERRRQWMDFDVFEAILTRLVVGGEWETIIPHKDGEPLLYPHIQDALRTLSAAHKGSFRIYTNGTHFSRDFHRFAGTLPNAFTILVSFHGHGADGTPYSTEHGTRELLAALDDPLPNVEYVAVTHATPFSDVGEIERWRNFWQARVGANTRLSAVHANAALNPWAGHIDTGTYSWVQCPYREAEHLFVGVTGNVLPCCLDLNEDLVLGNILHDPIEEIDARRTQFFRDVAAPEKRQKRCVACIGGCAA